MLRRTLPLLPLSLLAAAPATAQPANDTCANAIAITTGTFQGTNAGAGGADLSESCGLGDFNDVWYRTSQPVAGTYTVDTLASATFDDTVLSAFAGCGGEELACDDDSPPEDGRRLSRMSFAAAAGQNVFIRVAGFEGEQGPFTLTVAFEPGGAVPNDTCAAATPIAPGVTSGSNVGATGVASAACGFFNDFADVWYRISNPLAGQYFLDTEGSQLLDTTLAVYTACPTGPASQPLACDDDGGTELFSRIRLSSLPGETLFIRVAGHNGQTGPFQLNAAFVPVGAEPANDACTNATPIAAPFSGTGTTFAALGADISACGNGDTDDVWFALTPAASAVYAIDTAGSASDTVLSVFTSCAPSATELACSDNVAAPFDLSSRVLVRLDAGTTALVRVSVADGGAGPFTLNVGSPIAPLPNDLCSGATTVTAPSVTTGSTTIATGSSLSGCGDGDQNDLWYRLVAPVTGAYVIHTAGSVIDTTLSVYDSCNGEQTACSDDVQFESDPTSRLALFPLQAGQDYLLRVAGNRNGRGDFTLTLETPVPPPTNETCASALPAPVGQTAGSTLAATDDTAPSGCAQGDDIDVWYSFTAPGAGMYRFERSTGSLTDLAIAAFDTCASPDPLNCASTESSPNARFDLPLAAGQTILLRIAGTNGSRGDFLLTISGPTALPAAPANDACASATTIPSLPFSATVAVAGAGDDADVPCNDPAAAVLRNGVWYSLVPATSCRMLIGESSPTDAVFALYTGACGSLTEAACSDGDLATFELSAGVPYHLLVGRAGRFPALTEDAFTLSLRCFSALSNDTCATATAVAFPYRAALDTTAAGNDGRAFPSDCDSLNTPGLNASVFYRIESGAGGTLTGLVGTDYDAVVQLYSGAGCAALSNVACFDQPQPIAVQAQLLPATTYWLLVGEFDEGTGGTLAIDLDYSGAPQCRPDFNSDGTVNVPDIFAFLSAWFAQDPRANMNGDAAVNVPDIFAFLSLWFAGC